MRALISLYHQSETFITPENLSERIDQAFTGEKTGNLAFRSQPGIDTLSTFYNQAKLAPKFSEWDREKMGFGYGVWSQATYSRREWKVIEALYGVDASGSLEPLPAIFRKDFSDLPHNFIAIYEHVASKLQIVLFYPSPPSIFYLASILRTNT
ncbi:hypothetical protein LENED_003471 [Lentinula edodes]|uniref:Uncharacterized protein n=1 Tax=Lentinula edodes TaxID=5353 RepID=A0A1Q3E3P8_LENED|nr:hypothetical protein LENED_003471 [Lentinula edodes]